MDEEWDYMHRTITVYDEPSERSSLVLGLDGEPYKIVVKRKIGFDLTPRNNNGGKKNSSLQEGS